MDFTTEQQIVLKVFKRIADSFPILETSINTDPEGGVDLTMDIPAQPNLDFAVHLCLQQDDELYLGAGALWTSFFPCTDTESVDAFFEAVSGLLSGRYRVLERYRGSRAVEAELQEPRNGSWVTVCSWGLLFSLPWPRKRFVVIQNGTAA